MTGVGLALLGVGVALVWAGIRDQSFGDLIHSAFTGAPIAPVGVGAPGLAGGGSSKRNV